MLSKECKLHMEEAGMTRWQHFKHAIGIAFKLKLAVGAVFIHAFAPRSLKHMRVMFVNKLRSNTMANKYTASEWAAMEGGHSLPEKEEKGLSFIGTFRSKIV